MSNFHNLLSFIFLRDTIKFECNTVWGRLQKDVPPKISDFSTKKNPPDPPVLVRPNSKTTLLPGTSRVRIFLHFLVLTLN